MMSKSLYENIPDKQSKSEMQRIQSGHREFKNTYVPRGPADATPPAPLCKSRLQLFAPERSSRLPSALKMSGADQKSAEQAMACSTSSTQTTDTLAASKSSRLRPASIVRPYRAVSPSLQTSPANRPRTIVPAHGTPSRPQQAASQPSSPMRYASRSYSQNILGFQPARENYTGNNIFRPAVDQTEYARRVIARPPVATRSVSSSSDSSSRFHREEVQTPNEAASDSNSSARFQCIEAGKVSTEALRCLESRLRQLVMSKEALTSTHDSSSDYDTASVLLTPPEVPTRLSTSSRDGSPTLLQRKTLNTRLPVLKLLESNRYGPNFHEGPVSESSSSASLQDFTYDELRYLLQAVHNMLAMQPTAPNLDSQPQRPFSWYVAGNRASSEDAYQMGSAGTASPKPPPNTPKSLSGLDFDVLPLIDAEDFDLSPQPPCARQSAASTLLPPLLPAGFRNFSRYLDTKFGPDSSSVSLESIVDPQVANEVEGVSNSNAAPWTEAKPPTPRSNMISQEGLGRQQTKTAFSPVASIADATAPSYYAANVAKSWNRRGSAPVITNVPRQLPDSAPKEADYTDRQNRCQTAVTSPLTNERRIHTGPCSPTFSYFSDWPQNENSLASTPAYDYNISCLPVPSLDLAWSDYRSRAYWSTPQFLPYAWNAVPTPPPAPALPLPPPPPPTMPFLPSWFPFADYFGWCGPASPYGPHPHVMPPLMSVLPPQRPTFNPAADWFRAAANHFAAAAMFADSQMQSNASGQTNEAVKTTEAATAAAGASLDCRRPAQTSRYSPVPPKSEASRIPAKIAPSMRTKPLVAVNGTLVSGDEPNLPGPPPPPQHRVTGQSQGASISTRPSESPLTLPGVSAPTEDSRWSSGFRERLFEDLELPQDPALILPDYLDFYARIKGLLELDCSIVLPLPPGWSMGVSTSGRRFYICDRTRNTTWQHPVVAPRVPLGWERVEMRQGCVYYRHLLIPHAQRHHPDLWFPANLKNLENERQRWFFDLRKLQESVPNFEKGISKLIEDYADTMDVAEEAEFIPGFRQKPVSDLNRLAQQLDCRFFRDLHRIIVAYELARIRIVRQLLVRHNDRAATSSSTPFPSSSSASAKTV